MKSVKSLILLSFALVTCSSTQPTAVNRADWQFLAATWVNYGVDHDAIVFGDLRDDFRQIKLRITDAPLHMYDMKIYFDNGEVQDVSLKARFRQGDESRVIDLNGGLRHLRRIEFWYETKGARRGKARVAVWGKR
jgi:hypothetical protein